MSKVTGRTVQKAALKILQIDDLRVDPSYQRGVVQRHKKIISDFDQNALGVPVVGEREDGSFYIVDGLQRITALKALGKKEVRVEVFASNGPEHEAEVFRKINQNRTKLQPLQLYQAMLTEGDKDAWEVKKLVESFDFLIPKGGGPGSKSPPDTASRTLSCITLLMNMYKYQGEETLKFVLRILKESWYGDVNRVRGDILDGLKCFYVRRGGAVDEERLLNRLQSITPAKLIYSAQLGVGDRGNNVADVIQKIYNKKKSGGTIYRSKQEQQGK